MNISAHQPIFAIAAALALAPASAPAIEGSPRSRTFELTSEATVRDIPGGTKAVDLWLPVPQSDRSQVIRRVAFEAPGVASVVREPRSGNRYLHVRVASPGPLVALKLVIEATRREDSGVDEPLDEADRAEYLKAEPLVPLDGPIRALAEEATRGLTSDAERARAIYSRVAGLLKYDKTGTGWGRGDALFACDARRGNCTDFHALVIGMCRSRGIPARFAIGLPLPRGQGSGEVVGYHCWAELYVRGRGWVPVDASEASKDPSRLDYFFGHLVEDRLEFSRGRNLTLAPAQQGPPLNFFIYPYAEADGKPLASIDRKISFADREPSSAADPGRRP